MMISSNSCGILEQPERTDIELHLLLLRRWLGTDASGGRLRVLLLDGIRDVLGSDAENGEPVGAQPDAHGVVLRSEVFHITHAPHALDGIHQIDVAVVAEEDGVVGAVR